MKIRQKILMVGLLVMAAMAGMFVSKHAVLLKARAAAQSAAIPYTATKEELWVGPKGEDRGHKVYPVARRGDASTLITDGKITVLHYGAEDRSVEFTKEDNRIMTTGSGEIRTVPLDADCRHVPDNAERIGEDSILGHPSTHVRITFPDNDSFGGLAADDIWNAKDIGCLEIQRIYTFKDGSRDIQKLTAITIGEPDKKLFQLPPNPQETRPHEFFAGYHNLADAQSKQHMQSDAIQESNYDRDKKLRGE